MPTSNDGSELERSEEISNKWIAHLLVEKGALKKCTAENRFLGGPLRATAKRTIQANVDLFAKILDDKKKPTKKDMWKAMELVDAHFLHKITDKNPDDPEYLDKIKPEAAMIWNVWGVVQRSKSRSATAKSSSMAQLRSHVQKVSAKKSECEKSSSSTSLPTYPKLEESSDEESGSAEKSECCKLEEAREAPSPNQTRLRSEGLEPLLLWRGDAGVARGTGRGGLEGQGDGFGCWKDATELCAICL